MAGEGEQKGPETAEQQKPRTETSEAVPAAAKTRAEWRELLQSQDLDKLQRIENERDEKAKKREDLQKQAASYRTAESWTSAEAKFNSLTDGLAKSKISSQVDKNFAENMSVFTDVGIDSPSNVGALKNVAATIIFEHYTKTGRDEDVTENYVTNDLVPKLKNFFEKLKAVYDSNKSKFDTPLKFLEHFSNFAGMNFISGGALNEPNTKTALLLDGTSLEKTVQAYSESFSLDADVERLTGEASNLLGEKVDIGELFNRGQLKLNAKVRITVPPDINQLETVCKAPLELALPNNLSPAVKTRTVTWLMEQLKTKTPQPGETRELSENGQWSDKIDATQAAPVVPAVAANPSAGETQPAETQTGTPPEDTPQGTETTASTNPLDNLKTGNEFVDGIIDFIKSIIPPEFMDKISEWLGGFGGAAAEFAGLNDTEKQEGQALKEVAKNLKLNEKTMLILFKDATQMKLLIQKRTSENLAWDKYLEKYLAPDELEKLQKAPADDTNKAEKIAAMLVSEVPAPTA